MPHTEGLTFIRELGWPDVMDIWRSAEAGLAHWEALFSARGFSSWDEWRETYLQPLGLAARCWDLWQIDDPTKTVPDFICPPVRSLVHTLYQGNPRPTFAELVTYLGASEHQSTPAIMRAFPATTTVIGVLNDDGLVIVDGLHRCSAVALKARGSSCIEADLKIALARYEAGRLPFFGGAKKG